MAGYIRATVRADVFNAHIALAKEPLKKFMIGFVGDDFWPIGSGTLVKTCGFEGILTAYHVAAEVSKHDVFGLCIVDEWHLLSGPFSGFEEVPVGASPCNSPPETGPDLSFLVIRDSCLLAKLKELKEFYPLAKPPSLHPVFGTQHCWSINGTIGELSIRKETDDGPRARIRQFLGGGRYQHTLKKDGEFDYLHLSVPSGSNDFPNDYRGMSGGGFWLLPMEIDANEDLRTIRHREPVLAGVEFAQLERKNGERVLVGHGPDSIYRQLNRSIDRCIGLGFLEPNGQTP
jgi:hypothetical protein